MSTFTCDHCGAEVGLHDTACKRCGKLFDAVRCPRCGHQGPPSQFEKGCPSCRYLVPPRPPAPRPRLFTPLMAVGLGLLAVLVVVTWLLRSG